jgi:hypothetical protein
LIRFGKYFTNLTYDNGKKSIRIYITNAAESIGGKVTDVFFTGKATKCVK